MKTRHFTSILLAATALTACQNQGTEGESGVDAAALLDSMKGPDITGVDATMLKIAAEAENKGDFRAAAQTYQQIMDKNPKNAEVGIRYAESLRRSGKAESALEVFNKIIAEYPSNQEALEGKGLSELSLANLDAASLTLTKLNEMNPNRWRTLNAIGILFATRNLFDESLQYFAAALEKNPDHPAILNNKGLVQAMDRQFYPAIESLLAAGKASKTPAHLLRADLNAALVYAIAGDLDNAEIMAKKHLDGAALQNNLGLYALLAKDNDLARAHLNMALSESKMFYEKAWNNLGNVAQQSSAPSLPNEKRIQLDASSSKPATLPVLPRPELATPPLTSKAPSPPKTDAGATTSTLQTLPTNLAPLGAAASPTIPVETKETLVTSPQAPVTAPASISAPAKEEPTTTATLPAATEATAQTPVANETPATTPTETSSSSTAQTATEDTTTAETTDEGFSFKSLLSRLPKAMPANNEAKTPQASPNNIQSKGSALTTSETPAAADNKPATPAPTSNSEINQTPADPTTVNKANKESGESQKSDTTQDTLGKPSEPVVLKAPPTTSDTASEHAASVKPKQTTPDSATSSSSTPSGVYDTTSATSTGNSNTSSKVAPKERIEDDQQHKGYKALGDYITNW